MIYDHRPLDRFGTGADGPKILDDCHLFIDRPSQTVIKNPLADDPHELVLVVPSAIGDTGELKRQIVIERDEDSMQS